MSTVLDESTSNLFAAILGANAPQSYPSTPITKDVYAESPVVDAAKTVKVDVVKPEPIQQERVNVNTQSLKKGKTKDDGGGTGQPEQPKTTASQVKDYANATTEAIKAASYIGNAFIAETNGKMKANSYEYQAKQNERMAELLLMNQRDITRAAQADANVYKMQQKQVKSAQKVAMAESGFAVGKGVYKNKLDETDARVNYNVAAMMLKADLQNAELTRQAGTYEAQAIINRSDAEIARKVGKIERNMGLMNGIASLVSAGASFYSGMYPSETTITVNSANKGKK